MTGSVVERLNREHVAVDSVFSAKVGEDGAGGIWFTVVGLPAEIAIPTAFPVLWSTSTGLIVRSEQPRRHDYE